MRPQDNPYGNQSINVRLDDRAIRDILHGYPADIHDAVLWLARYIREECSQSFEILEAKAKKLGFNHNKTTFAKIVKGRWNRDASGNPLDSPVLSKRNLLQVVDALMKDHRISEQAGKVPFIRTPTAKLIQDYVDIRRAPDTICKFGLIIGPTGSQKTASLKQIAATNTQCRHLESPATVSMTDFITDLAAAYGEHAHSTMSVHKRRIRESVSDRSTIMLDNVQRLYRRTAAGEQPVFNFLQKLQDDTGCTVILCCSIEFERLFQEGIDKGYFEQFIGRCGGPKELLRLDDYASREDVHAIAEAFKLQDADDERVLAELDSIARMRGRIRTLFNALQKAARRAKDQKKTLSITQVRWAMKQEEDQPIR